MPPAEVVLLEDRALARVERLQSGQCLVQLAHRVEVDLGHPDLLTYFGGPGALIHVAPDGNRSTITTALFQPTGIVIGADGSVYIANRGPSCASAQDAAYFQVYYAARALQLSTGAQHGLGAASEWK